jgi:hypothetical protein
MAADPADQPRGAAAVVAAVAAVAAGERSREEALLAVTAEDLEAVLHAHFAGAAAEVVAVGLGA